MRGCTEKYMAGSVREAMKHCLDILLNVRIIAGEVGGTLSLIFLISYGLYKAWQEFIMKALK
jgi:hypothetical protein